MKRNYYDLNVQKSKSLTCKRDDSLISVHLILNSYNKKSIGVLQK